MNRTSFSPVPQSAVQRIQAMILSGEFTRGARLPSERQLAEQLAVSRASLREALSILQTMGLVLVERGRGAFVAADDGSGPVAPMPIWRFASRYTLREVYQFRLLTEGYAARFAAMAATDEQIEGLQRLVRVYKDATRTQDLVTSSQTDFDLHHLITTLSGNRILADLHENYRTIFLESQRLPMARHQRAWEPADEHEKLVQAIARRDSDGAEYYMRLHITRAADRVGIALSDTPQSDGAGSGRLAAAMLAARSKE